MTVIILLTNKKQLRFHLLLILVTLSEIYKQLNQKNHLKVVSYGLSGHLGKGFQQNTGPFHIRWLL